MDAVWIVLAFVVGLVLGAVAMWWWLGARKPAAPATTTPATTPAATAPAAATAAATTPAAEEPAAPAAAPTAAAPTRSAAESPVREFSGTELAKASEIIGRKVRLNDLRLIEGIGPKIEGLLNAKGIDTWHELASAPKAKLQAVLDEAGPRFRMHKPETWSKQARLLTQGKWAEFKKLTEELDGGL